MLNQNDSLISRNSFKGHRTKSLSKTIRRKYTLQAKPVNHEPDNKKTKENV